ncbi:MAG: hypothetical protein GWP10_10040, partial [Nitrospiraceae bacterium]|nr:hypothetical protein [Nitrospiraceae bacterium]
DFINKMGDSDIGIGQALRLLDISTEREILGIHVDADTIARSYRITGDEIDILITESFQRGILRDADWHHARCGGPDDIKLE